MANEQIGTLSFWSDHDGSEEPSAHDLEWARTFVETALSPGEQAEAGISILARLFAEKRRAGARNE